MLHSNFCNPEVLLPKRLKFTDLAIQSLQPPAQGQTEYWDTSLTGFGVRVSYGGTKTFFVMFDRRRRTLGKYPKVSLKQARQAAGQMIADPTVTRRKDHDLELTYVDAVERYLITVEDVVKPRTHGEYSRLLRLFDLPGLVSEIRPYQVEDALARVNGQSNRSHAYTALKIFFNWCRAREFCTSNPLQYIKKPKVPASRERVLEDDELRAIWKATEQLGNYGSIVRLLMLTGQRRGQIDRLQTSWVSADGISFPASVMKNGQEHWCPLGSLARYELMRVVPVDDYYFSPVTAVGRPFTAWSKNKRKLDELVRFIPGRYTT